ncbi:hypothetical protein EIK77_001396 [Talaromyces pinophilus]|nr:hypothetical protein EIK77_001396 [Talaromyces pinophilus]
MTVVAAAWSFDENSPDPEKQTRPDKISEAFKELSQASKDLIVKSIALNSTAFEEEKNGNKEFVGSKTEVAMLELAKDHLGMNTREERANAEIVQMFPFESSRKCMGVVYREPSTVGYRLLVKGAAEMLLKSATSTAKCQVGTSIVTEHMTEDERLDIHERINCYAEQSLRTIGMVYKDLPCWPPTTDQPPKDDSSEPDFESLLKDMTWIGVVGIQDPLRPEVPDAIQKCNSAGVQVKMVSGDNLKTATAIARACGILTDGIVMEGPKFRQLSDAELDEVAPRLQVLARSSPDDKRVLVERLKRLGETVAVTGDGTNDGPALKTADVGFSMGIAGTEVAKEASSIILLDDNFKSIITALAWGRAFQITVNITAVILTFVSAVHSGSNESVLTAVQLLWVNLIMDTFAALALATDGPNDKILQRKPVPKSAPLFTMNMWKMIIGQSIYKLVVTLTLYFAGHDILRNILDEDKSQLQLDTIIFNTFVWMQIFNELNNRRLDNHLNIFEGITKNYWFIGINCVIIGGQILIIFVGGVAIGVTPLNGIQWAVCLICAVVTLPVGVLLRFLPDEYFAVVFNFTVDGFKLLLRPIQKVFHIVGRSFKVIIRPFSRKPRSSADGLV